ncbi:two-component sensor histidine kinase [Paenibacillus oryzae]|uniref:histidine kinase n=1 Tax=Paenibacillus oryzae TaxID=1844972 RepID=A0A1A5YFB5_9BACL|nr:HAMP domain-containing sensor histidine kinase [Paenibacillus oryzae]OBR64321.1 two-component sensor histidine kinase [Paenibacillus oryzae]
MGKGIKKRQTSILSYWTIRYFLILFVSLGIIATCAVYWIMESALNSRLKTAGLLGQEVAERVVAEDGKLKLPPYFDKLLDSRLMFFNIDEFDLCFIIMDADGHVVYSRPQLKDDEIRKKLSDDLTHARDKRFIAVTTPIMNGDQQEGQVTLLQSKMSLYYKQNEIVLVAVLLLTLTLGGWLTLYLLSRKLSRPISRVAESARQIAAGHYDFKPGVQARESEINDLMESFGHMAARLKHLEEWRELSLAGVTHELKTPVTSIKGLLLAVREGVVIQEEADEFMDIALKETSRLERMVADLLNYNAFSSGSLEVTKDVLDLCALIQEIIYQWGIAHEDAGADIQFHCAEKSMFIVGDALRIQQIMVNLLNNGLQSAHPGRPLQMKVRLAIANGSAVIEVEDNGSGIPELEQPYIFERFFRGEHKKRTTRGLGLGLTYSRLLARAQGGELKLARSSAQGSVFALELGCPETVAGSAKGLGKPN